MIDRKQLIGGHNPVLHSADVSSPLTVGNGELAFTADVTGMQTLYSLYKEVLPLCTMSQWGWHTEPVSDERYDYTLDDLKMTEYDFQGRKVGYAQKRLEGNEEVYDWLRVNPHRLNLARIGLIYKGKEIAEEMLTEVKQELNLYEGILYSRFQIDGIGCTVKTACCHTEDVLAFEIDSEALSDGLQIAMEFPYGAPDITASDWNRKDAHRTEVLAGGDRELLLKRTLDRDTYFIRCQSERSVTVEADESGHRIVIGAKPSETTLRWKVGFAEVEDRLKKSKAFAAAGTEAVMEDSRRGFKAFWEKGGIIKMNQSKDPRAWELERRVILSQYLMAVNSSGSRPPQETGLTCNSWYGKMHLEMYLWHCAWLPLWNHTDMLEKSLRWYGAHLKEARENAARNGYKGARWPKMIASEGIDTPSSIATLLVWQQPHIIYMLELAYRRNPSDGFLKEYWEVVKETAEFMVDFVVYDKETGVYNIEPPVIPVQECHKPEETRNPTFEVEYWHFTLELACQWAHRLQKDADPLWKEVADHMAPLPERDGLYEAHEWCTTTFTRFNIDHPSMLGAFGLIPGDRADRETMKRTFDRVVECWNYGSLWGWDFAMMAMTAVRLGEPELAIDILMKETLKNSYVASGNNLQKSRKDLPLYLPGNGALLLAIPMMAAGYQGCKEELPGFPKNGQWEVEFENIQAYFA